MAEFRIAVSKCFRSMCCIACVAGWKNIGGSKQVICLMPWATTTITGTWDVKVQESTLWLHCSRVLSPRGRKRSLNSCSFCRVGLHQISPQISEELDPEDMGTYKSPRLMLQVCMLLIKKSLVCPKATVRGTFFDLQP